MARNQSPFYGAKRINQLLSPECQAEMRRIISQSRGSEVYFIGSPDAHGRVVKIDAFGFGMRDSVPVSLLAARWGDLVFHNHPNGNLDPSCADIRLGAEFALKGVGAYVVNNECTKARLILKPSTKADPGPIDHSVIANLIRLVTRMADQLNIDTEPNLRAFAETK